jgi:RNA polymerase sigma-54 factor
MKTLIEIESRQTQKILMNGSLLQAIKILQMSQSEIWSLTYEVLESNPLVTLENFPDGSDFFCSYPLPVVPIYHRSSLESIQSIASHPVSLIDSLMTQLRSHTKQAEDLIIGREIIQLINSNGYFEGSIDWISEKLQVLQSKVEKVLKLIQTFEPSGIAAQSLTECLRVQVEDQGWNSPEMNKFLNYLPLLEKCSLSQFSEQSTLPLEVCIQALQLIRSLNPKPGLQFEKDSPLLTMIPDLFVVQEHSQRIVYLNPQAFPKVTLNMKNWIPLEKRIDKNDWQYISLQKMEANWFIRALAQRARNLLRVAQAIVDYQDTFFERGSSGMKPLSLQMLAKKLGIHESTVSRVITEKYISMLGKIYPLKEFLTHNPNRQKNLDTISVKTVLNRITQIVRDEPPSIPYSDDQLANILMREGIRVARRTITKYRKILRIQSSCQRRESHQRLF